jgi:hypothetical protein
VRASIASVVAGLALLFAGLQPATAAEPDLSKMTGGELVAFTRAMPKGGELHNHIGATIFAETELGWAVDDGGCVDAKALALRPPPCEGDLKPAKDALADPILRSLMIDSLTTRKPDFAGRSDHDQFFSSFGRMWFAPYRQGDVLAAIMDRLARENTFYIEAMVTPQGQAAADLGLKVGWDEDLPALKARLAAAGIEKLADQAKADTDAWEARARQVLKCGTAQAWPGCAVTVRYLVQAIRVLPPEGLFAQLDLGVMLIRKDPRWVGLQLVAPEDDPAAIRYYDADMRMVGFLSDQGRKVKVALHAGELTLSIATPQDLDDHIAKAIHVAGASRIGHGVDIAHEDAAEALAAEMAKTGVLVEINLTSNAVILGVKGKAHPYAWLRARGVPTSLSTDDAGILRIDLSHEYARAVAEQGATYADLKASARNALAFSFLEGEGLWSDPGIYSKPVRACRKALGRERPDRGPCADLLASSDKAREQWRLEYRFKRFEAAARQGR